MNKFLEKKVKFIKNLLSNATIHLHFTRFFKADRAHHAEELVGESSLNALMKKEVAQRPKRQFGGFG